MPNPIIPVLLRSQQDVISIGKGLSELEDLLADAAKKQGRYMADEGHPEAGYYYRSDHFNFAKGGVPSLHFDDGTDMELIKREDVEKQKEALNNASTPAPEVTPTPTPVSATSTTQNS